MNEILITALSFSLMVQFIYACFWEGMIFGKAAGWLIEGRFTKARKFKSRVPLWTQKIMFGCPICMTPYYSVIFLALLSLSGYLVYPIGMDILIIFVASGISTIFSTFYD